MPEHVTIETSRLILRTATMEDVDAVAESWRLDDGTISRQEAAEQIRWMIGNHRQNAPGRLVHLCLAIVHKDSGHLIGWCGLDNRNRAKTHPVLFYVLKSKYWGHGLATEAAEATLHYALGELGVAQVDGAAAQENAASRRVMEKLGMKYLGPDEEGGHLYALTREEYLRG